MKRIYYFLMPALLVWLYGCNGSEGQEDTSIDENWQITETNIYQIDSSLSIVKWIREVDNKKVNKKVKIFGSYADVTMENVKFSSEGEFIINKGELLKINGGWSEGIFELDFSTLKLYSEESENFFVTTDYPNSTLSINSITEDSLEAHYILNSSLSILDSTKNLAIPVEIVTDSLENISLNGVFTIQTLEWPLKENPEPENVRKDEITITMDLVFSLAESKTDSVKIN